MKQYLKKYSFFIGVLIVIGIFVAILTLNTSESKEAIIEIKKALTKEIVLKSWNK